MKPIIFFVMITCWAAPSVAQQLSVMLGAGSRDSGGGSLQIDSMQLDIINTTDNHFLIPGIELEINVASRWVLDFDIRIQSGGISPSVSDIPPVTCALCTVRKGVLISYTEIMTGGMAGFNFIESGDWRFRISAGLVWSYRVGIQKSPSNELTNLSPEAIQLLEQTTGMVRRQYWNYRFAILLQWKKLTLRFDQIGLLEASMSAELSYGGRVYPVRLDQQSQAVSLQYTILSF